MGFPRQEDWSGLPFPSSGDLPDPGIKPVAPILASKFFTTEPLKEPHTILYMYQNRISFKNNSLDTKTELKQGLILEIITRITAEFKLTCSNTQMLVSLFFIIVISRHTAVSSGILWT